MLGGWTRIWTLKGLHTLETAKKKRMLSAERSTYAGQAPERGAPQRLWAGGEEAAAEALEKALTWGSLCHRAPWYSWMVAELNRTQRQVMPKAALSHVSEPCVPAW